MNDDSLQEEQDLPPSKSALKRDMEIIRNKVEALVDLPNKKLDELPLSEALRDGITLARRLKKNDSRRRQIQYLTKLLKQSDMSEIDQALEQEQQKNRNFRQRFHQLEQWRDQLLENSDETINQLVTSNPQLDRQHLRQLCRQAKREKTTNKPPAASRKIFKYLQETLS